MRRLVSIVFLALTCVAAFSQNNAADSLYLDSIYRHLELEEYTITARVKEKDIIIPQTLAGVELKKMNALSVADAIRYFSGVQIKDYGGVGGIKTVNIRSEFSRIGVRFPDFPIFCTLKHYTKEANIPLKQNPNVLKPPRLDELTKHFGLTQDFIASKCQKWYGGGDHYHDARFDAAAAYLCMVVGEGMG